MLEMWPKNISYNIVHLWRLTLRAEYIQRYISFLCDPSVKASYISLWILFTDLQRYWSEEREKDASLEICANIECWCFHGVKFVQHSEWDSESTIPAMQIDNGWFSKRQTRVMSKSQSTSVWLISWEVDYLQQPLVTDALASTHRPLILEQFHPCLTMQTCTLHSQTRVKGMTFTNTNNTAL